MCSDTFGPCRQVGCQLGHPWKGIEGEKPLSGEGENKLLNQALAPGLPYGGKYWREVAILCGFIGKS